MKFDTKVVRAGILPDPSTGAIVPPIYQSATYVLDEVGKDKGYDYTRASNPTREILENNLAALDGGRYGICFSSGMAAVDSVMKILKSGYVFCAFHLFSRLRTDYVGPIYLAGAIQFAVAFVLLTTGDPGGAFSGRLRSANGG